MSTDIAAAHHEFTDALTEVLAENAVGPARRGRACRPRRERSHPRPVHECALDHPRPVQAWGRVDLA